MLEDLRIPDILECSSTEILGSTLWGPIASIHLEGHLLACKKRW